MAWSTPRTWVAGETITAAKLNTIRDNLEETVPGVVAAAGDIIYATGANAIAILPIGSASQTLKVNSGATAPEWVT